MQVFAVFRVTDQNHVRARLKEFYPENHFDDGYGVFFVASDGETTKQVASKIGIGDDDGGGVTSGIVTPMTTYWGRAPSELWEWVSVKRQANGS